MRSLFTSLRPTALSAFGLFTSSPSAFSRPNSTSAARCTRFLVRQPFEGAPRECPTPVVLLGAPGLRAVNRGKEGGAGGAVEEDQAGSWESWAGMFAERGYTVVEADIEPPPRPTASPQSSVTTTATTMGSFDAQQSANDGDDLTAAASASAAGSAILRSMSSELAHQIRLLAIPFPPILIAQGATAQLVGQTYVSDHPASGLVMVAPTSSLEFATAEGGEQQQQQGLLKAPEFNYEPRFPILVLSPPSLAPHLEQSHRLVRDHASAGVGRGGKGVSWENEATEDIRSERNRMTIERWMDRCGF